MTYEEAFNLVKDKTKLLDRDQLVDLLARVGLKLTASKSIFIYSLDSSKYNMKRGLKPTDEGAK